MTTQNNSIGSSFHPPFGAIGQHLLTMLLRGQGVSGPEAAAAHVLAGFDELALHPDVPEALRRLHAGGVRLVTFTNGSAALTEGLLARGGVRGLVEHVLDVEAPGRWKPAAQAYRYAVGVAGVPVQRAAMVAVHPWDVDGALRAGLTGAYLDRDGAGYPAYLVPPTVTAPSMTALADALLAM